MAALRLVLLVLALGFVACGDDEPAREDPARTAPGTQATTAEPSDDEDAPARAERMRVETVATGLEVPWDLAFLPDGGALITERGGAVRLLQADGDLRDEPVADVEVDAVGEGGLMGIALDPGFADGRRFAYLYATVGDGNEVQRWRVADDGSLRRDGVVLDGIRRAPIHDGGRLRFGPDGRLYVPTGDAGAPTLAQEPDSLNGKVLVLDREQYRGSAGDPEVFTRGHRNVQGLDWHPETGRLYATEHGPRRNDEINRVREGGNYGWPRVQGPDHGEFTAPARVYTDFTLAPAGAAFLSSPGSEWTGDLFVAGLRGRQLRRLEIHGDDVRAEEALLEGEYGRLRAVVEGPDGALYVTTSNRDGRGDPAAQDDRLLRVVPPRG